MYAQFTLLLVDFVVISISTYLDVSYDINSPQK